MEKLKELLKIKNMSIKDFALSLGINYRTAQNYLSGKTMPNIWLLEEMATLLGVSANFLLNKTTPTKERENFSYIPRYDIFASAGSGEILFNEENISDTLAINNLWLTRRGIKPKNLFFLQANGESMEPKISHNDFLLIDSTKKLESGDGIFVFSKENRLFIKQLEKTISGIMIKSLNQNYSSYELTNEDFISIEIIGRCVLIVHEP